MASLLQARLLPLLLAAACAQAPTPSLSAYPELAQAMREFEVEQNRFSASTMLPKKFEFPGNGEVTVLDAALDGYPGNTYVRARWSYQNTTGRPVLRALVSLDILDADGKLVASKVSVCIFPTPRLMYDGTYFSDELRTQTHGVHEQPGWSWRITCRSEYIDEDELYQPKDELLAPTRR